MEGFLVRTCVGCLDPQSTGLRMRELFQTHAFLKGSMSGGTLCFHGMKA